MTPSTQQQRHIKPALTTVVRISGSNYVKVYKSIENQLRSSFLLHYQVHDQILEAQILQELENIPGQHPEIFLSLVLGDKEIVLLSIGRKCIRNNRSKTLSLQQPGASSQPGFSNRPGVSNRHGVSNQPGVPNQPGFPNPHGFSKPSQFQKIQRLSEGEVKQRPQKREYSSDMEDSIGQLTTLHEDTDVMMGAFSGPDHAAPYSLAPMKGNELDWMSMNRMRNREDTQNELVKARNRFDMSSAALQRDRGGSSGMPMDFMHDNSVP